MDWLRRCLAIMLLLAASPSRADTRVALVIGNSTYDAVGALPNPERDAALMAATLESAGFSVTLVRNASRSAMLDALNSFNERADEADWALVFYAGHGIEIGGTNYLLPTDAQLKVDRNVQDEAVSLTRVLDTVANARKLRMVILDACRNNPFAATMRCSVATRAVGRGLSRPEPQAGVIVVYSAAAGEVAEDGLGQHSPFTTALASRLTQPGLEIRHLFDVVTADVLHATGHRQRPYQYGSNPSEESYFFVPPSPEVGRPPQVSSPPEQAKPAELHPPAPVDTFGREFSLWNAAKERGTVGSYEAYLKAYPSGTFADVARDAVRALREGVALEAQGARPRPAGASDGHTSVAALPPERPARPAQPAARLFRIKRNVSLGILNMRDGPGQQHQLLSSIPVGSGGVSMGACRQPDDGRSTGAWCAVRWNGRSGWVSSNGLERE